MKDKIEFDKIFDERNIYILLFNQRHVKRAFHYPFTSIRFLEINKLYNVITGKLTFSTNQKLISIN